MAFSFISYSHLLIAVQPFNVIPARAGDHQPRFLIVDIDKTACRANSSEPVGEYVAICELHLPEMQPYVEIEEILIRCDPPPVPQARMSENKVAENKSPAFVTSSQNRLFVITLSATVVMDDAGDHRAIDNRIICIFIPLSTLTPFLNRDSDLAESIPSTKPNQDLNLRDFQNRAMRDIAVPWTDWMQYGSRALSIPGAELVWVCNVFGSRFVHAVEPFDAHVPRAARRIAVLDFNNDTLRFDLARKQRGEKSRESSPVSVSTTASAGASESQSEAETQTQIETSSESLYDLEEEEKDADWDKTVVQYRVRGSTLEAGTCGVFEEDVTTYLPYRRTVFSEKMRFDGVMLAEDNIVFVHVGVSCFVSSSPVCMYTY